MLLAKSVAASLLVALLVAGPAAATTMRRATLPELTRDAALVVVGVVGASRAFWDGGRIVTRHELDAVDVWKGPRAAKLSVLTLGGVVGTIGQRVEGEAVLPAGRRVVLFLEPHPRLDGYRVVSLHQGAFLVDAEASSSADPTLAPAGAPLSAAGLPDFKRRVLELLRAP